MASEGHAGGYGGDRTWRTRSGARRFAAGLANGQAAETKQQVRSICVMSRIGSRRSVGCGVVFAVSADLP